MKAFATLVLISISISMTAQNDLSLAEYANFAKYAAANAALGEPKDDEKRVVFMGNSITEAWVNYSPEFFSKNNYIGRGISGQVTHQMLLRFRNDVIALQPHVVVILAGTNDIAQNSGPISLEQIADNIMNMVDIALQNDITVMLCSVLPAKDYPWKPGLNPLEKIPELNKMLERYADRQPKVSFIDWYEAMVDKEGGMKVPRYTTAEDLVHPNKAGYEMMEALIHPHIMTAVMLSKKRR